VAIQYPHKKSKNCFLIFTYLLQSIFLYSCKFDKISHSNEVKFFDRHDLPENQKILDLNVLLVNKLIFMQKIEIGETAKFLVI